MGTRVPSTITVPELCSRVSGMGGTAGAKTCSSAVSILFRMRLIVGWETPKSSAKKSSVWFWRRYSRVAFSPWVRVSLWGLVFGVFQVRVLVRSARRVVNCAGLRPVVRWEGNGSYLCVYGWWLVLVLPSYVDKRWGVVVFLCGEEWLGGWGVTPLMNNPHRWTDSSNYSQSFPSVF